MTNRFSFARPFLVVFVLLAAALVATALGSVPVAAQDTQADTQAPAQPDTPPDPEARPKPKPKPQSRYKDRVFLTDLEGTWIARDYLERLRNSRAPHATARRATGIAIKIEKDGPTYPILITDFQKAILNFVIDIQPDVKPGSYRLAVAEQDRPGISAADLTYIYFRGERDANGVFQTLSIAEPNFARKRYLTYLRLNEPLETFVNRATIAGKYLDAEGRSYEFTEAGEAILPDRTFQYEVSLDPRRANCELIISHREHDPQGKERIGYAWKGATLQLYEVLPRKKPPYKCKGVPFAVLTRQ
jgi:hypothetical protein